MAHAKPVSYEPSLDRAGKISVDAVKYMLPFAAMSSPLAYAMGLSSSATREARICS
jgi:hypothetical protein